MTSYQYTCTVKNNEIIEEKGHFFKAGSFTVMIEKATYQVVFEHRDDGKVFHIISVNKTDWLQLRHPDYVPDCSFEDLNTFCKNPHTQTLFYALCKHGLSIKKDYLKWIDANNEKSFSYSIHQAALIT